MGGGSTPTPTPTPAPSGLVIDWRTPLTVITDLSGTSDAAMLAQQQTIASKGRSASFAIPVNGTSGRIIDLPASSQPILVDWAGMIAASTAIVEVSTDGGATWVDQAWAPCHPGGVTSVSDRRQRHIFPAGAARKARITIGAGDFTGVTIKMLVHTIPASGVPDTTVIIGASREYPLTSDLMEAAIIAEQPDRDPVVWNYGQSAATSTTIAASMTRMQSLFGKSSPSGGTGSAYIGSAVGNDVSNGRVFTDAQKPDLDANLNTILDACIAITGAPERVVMTNTSYRAYTTTGTSTQGPATPPTSQTGGSLEYNLAVVDPRIAARLPHAYDPTLLRAREDEYLSQLGDYLNLADEVHQTAQGTANSRVFHAKSAFRFLRYGTWPASQIEQRVAAVEASSLQSDHDAATNALAAIAPAASARAGLQSRIAATVPAVRTKAAGTAVTKAEATRTQADKDAAQTALNAAVAVQTSATTSQNQALQTRLDAVAVATFTKAAQINLGNAAAVAGWNDHADTTAGASLALADPGGVATGWTVTNLVAFGSSSANGYNVAAESDGGTFPGAVNRAYFSRSNAAPSGVRIDGLDAAKRYDVYVSVARTGTGTIEQTIKVGTVTGGVFNASAGAPVVQSFKDSAASGGSLTIEAARAGANTGFVYMSAIIIWEHS